MTTVADRLALDEAVLAVIQRKRAETGDEGIGASIEREIIDRQIREIQREIFEDPGAIEPFLIKMRR
jgi:hypothetical protein